MTKAPERKNLDLVDPAASGPDFEPSRRTALAGMTGLALLGASGASLAQAPGKGAPAKSTAVDLLLVLAVDASGSVSQKRFTLQRQGYAQAFRNPRVFRSIRSGMLGAIGCPAHPGALDGAPVGSRLWARARASALGIVGSSHRA